MDLKQLKDNHVPDGRVVDVKPILGIVEDVFNHFSRVTPGVHVFGENVCGGVFDGDDGMPEDEALICIQNVFSEIKCKCSVDDGSFIKITTSLLKMLSKYSWEDKAVIALAAVAIAYGELSMVVQLCNENDELAKSVAVLKQLTELTDHHSYTLNSCFKALKELNCAMWDVTLLMLEFLKLIHGHQEILSEKLDLFRAKDQCIPNAGYYIIRSVVACVKAVNTSYEYFVLIREKFDLTYLASQLRRIHKELKLQVDQCNLYIDEKKRKKEYEILVCLFKSTKLDIIKFLRQLICIKEDIHVLVKGTSKVSFEHFKKKKVVLLISSLDVSLEELKHIDHLYRESRHSHECYEILWIPMIGETATTWTTEHYHKFEQLRGKMSFYTLLDPQKLEAASLSYIRKEWHFTRKTILVALDHRAKDVCSHALDMFLIWGFEAFPFTAMSEEILWRQVTLKLDLFVISTDLSFQQWIREDRYICVYGGENEDWVRQFTSAAKQIARAAGITLELVYIRTRRATEKTRKITAIIEEEGLSHSWSEATQVSYFWTKIESMLYSKSRFVKNGMETDSIIKSVTALLSFDSKREEWATIWHGNKMARAHGDIILTSFNKFEEWEVKVRSLGFIEALNEQIQLLHTSEHCSRVILPGFEGVFSDNMFCFECQKPMEKYFMYRCCTD